MAGGPGFDGVTWHAACNNGNCVEVAFQDGWVGVRDGKQERGPILAYTEAEWVSFIEAAKQGRFDLARLEPGAR
ncbi:DUF397 domain-containing protein [Sphaerisporangium sp. TRM90804]|uniref:DUF397 domain-containing protein n=1 Tax=Sphaerisporangium sp. TRM90804 TaxID=3031113 RepID=UPI0024499827|nr:DUF397 domain-containing protein [Sphaerisporangium sp. TRM90804]MDH2428065.1 DUF397 domain-containing protein [Sphaerisporangium sp. TRM90804]